MLSICMQPEGCMENYPHRYLYSLPPHSSPVSHTSRLALRHHYMFRLTGCKNLEGLIIVHKATARMGSNWYLWLPWRWGEEGKMGRQTSEGYTLLWYVWVRTHSLLHSRLLSPLLQPACT